MQKQNNKRFKGVNSIIGKLSKSAVESEVQIGDRFLAASTKTAVWVVDRVTTVKSSHHPLVSLRREDKPDLIKTISVGALTDSDDFVPVVCA